MSSPGRRPAAASLNAAPGIPLVRGIPLSGAELPRVVHDSTAYSRGSNPSAMPAACVMCSRATGSASIVRKCASLSHCA